MNNPEKLQEKIFKNTKTKVKSKRLFEIIV